MKKIILLSACSLIISISFAQLQRKAAVKNTPDSAVAAAGQDRGESRKQIMKDLNLSKEQKGKLKEQRQALQAKKQEIENDDKLTPEQKEAKLKELKKEQTRATMEILNREQKMKLLELRKNKKGNATEEMELN